MSVLKSMTWCNETRRRAKRRSILPPWRSHPRLEVLEERALLAVFHVSLTGDDGNVGSAAEPFRTVQQAINAAAASDDGDDVVKVQAGTYDTPLDLGFTVPSDDELDSLDIIGSFNATFTTSDVLFAATNYHPQDSGGSISLGDDDTILDSFNFGFDGTNSGIELSAGNIELVWLDISNATHGVIGDGISGTVHLLNTSIVGNSASGLTLTNHTGDLFLEHTFVLGNGDYGLDFEGSNGSVVLESSGIQGSMIGARIVNPGGEVSFSDLIIQESVTAFQITDASNLTLADLRLLTNTVSGGHIENVDTVIYRASTGSPADSVELTDSQMRHTRSGNAQQPIEYSGVTSLVIETLDGDDTISISGNPAGIPITSLTVLAGAGNDTIIVTEPTSDALPFPTTVEIDAGDDHDGLELNLGRANTTTAFSLDGGLGTNGLSVFTRSAGNDSVVVDGQQIVAALPATKTINYQNLYGIIVVTAEGADSIVINEPPTGTFPTVVDVLAQEGDDGIEINLGRPDTNTNFNIDGGDGFNPGDSINGMTVFTRSANDNELTISIGQLLVRPRSPSNLNAVKTILHSQVRGLTALADAGNDTFRVEGSFLGNDLRALSLFGQDDNDLLDYFLLDPGLASYIHFSGGNGFDNRIDVVGPSIFVLGLAIDSERIEMPTFGPSFYATDYVEYESVNYLRVVTGDHPDTISISQKSGTERLPLQIEVYSNGGDDNVTVDLKNVPAFVEIHVDLGTGDDELKMLLPPTQPSWGPHGTLFVKGGLFFNENDTVFVNADPSQASQLTVGNFSSNELLRLRDVSRLVMTGGEGDDVFTNNTSTPSILDGLRGNDSLTGGTGRDFLLGEGGADLLAGGDEQDLLVSGPVTYDHHLEMLLEIFDLWLAEAPFNDRVVNLRDNNYLVAGGNVFDEGAIDTLVGGTDIDWLIAEVPNDAAREAVEFIINPANSTLQATGHVKSTDGNITVNISPQVPGSLTGTLQGHIDALYSAGVIQFLDESDVDFIEQPGPFLPGDLPADLAGMIFFPEGYAALRDLHVSGRSSLISISGTSFAANKIQVFFTSGTIAAHVTDVFTGAFQVSPVAQANNGTAGSIVSSGATVDLTLPIDSTITVPISSQFTATLRLQGTIIAAGSVPVEPDLVSEIPD